MKHTKRIAAVLIAATAAVVLAGCGATAATVTPKDVLTNTEGYNSGFVETPQGKVFCIESPRYDLSCDWANVDRTNE